MNTFDPGSPPDTVESTDREPLLEPADHAKFLLRGKGETLPVLRGLHAARDRIAVYFNEGRDFLLSAVITVDDDAITLDCGGDAAMNRRALEAAKVLCVTRHEKVRVQFALHGLQRVDHEGRPAFRAKLPEEVLRLQRREYYRLSTPIANPLKCVIPMAGADGAVADVEVNIVDISGGGLALSPPANMTFEKDMRFANCRVELPEVGTLVATLQVRSVFEVALRSGAKNMRVGCQYVRLPGPMLTLVQRYIIKVERERQARDSGIA